MTNSCNSGHPAKSSCWQIGIAHLLGAFVVVSSSLALYRTGLWPLASAIVVSMFWIAAYSLPKQIRSKFIAILACTYIPYVWSYWEDFPGGKYWDNGFPSDLGTWPIAPGINAELVMNCWPRNFLSATATIVFVAAGTTTSLISKKQFIGTCILVFCASAFLAYHARHWLHNAEDAFEDVRSHLGSVPLIIEDLRCGKETWFASPFRVQATLDWSNALSCRE